MGAIAWAGFPFEGKVVAITWVANLQAKVARKMNANPVNRKQWECGELCFDTTRSFCL